MHDQEKSKSRRVDLDQKATKNQNWLDKTKVNSYPYFDVGMGGSAGQKTANYCCRADY